MRILIVTHYFWPETFRINDLALAWKAKGYHVSVLTGMPNYPEGKFYQGYQAFSPTYEIYEGVPIYRVPVWPRKNSSRINLALNYISGALSALLFAPFRLKKQYDCIFVFLIPFPALFPAILLKKLWKIPVIYWAQDLWPESLQATSKVNSGFILKVVGKFVRFVYRQCDKILIQSRTFEKAIEAQGVPSEKISYFPNWAEDFYQPLTLELDAPERKLVPNGFVLMFAGNIGAAQAVGTILEAAEKLRAYTDIFWVIIGEGSEKRWFEEQVQKRGLQECFRFLGRYPPEAMPRYFSLANALLVTLKKNPIYSVTIPSRVQSYLACGRPIIGAIDGEGANIITQAGGLAGPAEDAEALANNVLTLYRMNDEQRLAAGEKALVYFKENFERGYLLAKIDRILQESIIRKE